MAGVLSPVDMPKKWGETKFLCSMEYITVIVDSAAIKYETSYTVDRTTFHHFFLPNCLPMLLVLCNGGDLGVVVNTLCRLLFIICNLVIPDNNESVHIYQFFRFLNKA